MRLTLRTLLAYLDDILEPSDAKEIGKKISESSVANGLMNRIREVMRRRRLTAPDVDGPGAGLDPNLVSEYLDNSLESGSVADVEKVCLDSDVHLAEVAACHQILTLVFGEPVVIRPDTRERMYALGPMGSALPASAEKKSKRARKPAASPESDQTGTEAKPAASESQTAAARSGSMLPEYLKPTPFIRRSIPYIVVAVVAGVWIGTIIRDPSLNIFPPEPARPAAQTADQQAARGDLVAQAQPEPPAGAAEHAFDAPLASGQEQQPAADAAAPMEQATGENGEPSGPDADGQQPPVVEDEPPVPTNLREATEEPEPAPNERPAELAAVDESETKPRPQGTPGEAKPVGPLPEQLVPAEQAPEVQYNSLDGVLFLYSPDQGDWLVVPHRSLIHPGERIAVPEPYDAQFDIGRRLCRVTVYGPTSLQFLAPTTARPFGLRLTRGRIVVEGKPTTGTNPDAAETVRLGVAVMDELWELELLSPETRCGIEIQPPQPQGIGQFGPDLYTGKLYVVSGSVRFSDQTGREQIVQGPGSMLLTPGQRDQVEEARPGGAKMMFAPWLDPNAPPMSVITRRFAELFEVEIDKDQPISLSLPAIVKHRRPRISELAVKALGLVGSYESLVQALARTEHEESRRAAIGGIRYWLAESPANGDLLSSALEKNFQPENVETVYRLLWGYGETDAQDPDVSQQLVGWLQHAHIAVRELAIFHIERLAGRRYDYRPNLPPAQRRAAVERWATHVQKEGALVGQ